MPRKAKQVEEQSPLVVLNQYFRDAAAQLDRDELQSRVDAVKQVVASAEAFLNGHGAPVQVEASKRPAEAVRSVRGKRGAAKNAATPRPEPDEPEELPAEFRRSSAAEPAPQSELIVA